MPAWEVYHEIRAMLQPHVAEQVDASSLERLTLLVVGILKAEHAAPARIAQALHESGLSAASAERIERRIRRVENDPEISAALCVPPLARYHLALGRPQELLVILDPTTQQDRVVLVTAAVWYRGRALPLAWAVWPANTPLEGERFWARVSALLDQVAALLPPGVPVTWLADCACGTPSFLDLLRARGWHDVVRVQDQTVLRDRLGREVAVRHLLRARGQRLKCRGELFKKRGGRRARLVAAGPGSPPVSGGRLLPRSEIGRLALRAGPGDPDRPSGALAGRPGVGYLAGALAGHRRRAPARRPPAQRAPAHPAVRRQVQSLPVRPPAPARRLARHCLVGVAPRPHRLGPAHLARPAHWPPGPGFRFSSSRTVLMRIVKVPSPPVRP